MNKNFLILLFFTVILVLCGCNMNTSSNSTLTASESVNEATALPESSTPEAITDITATKPAETPIPTISPTPAPNINIAPDIIGFTRAFSDETTDRIEYYAEAENSFGLKENEYAGVFIPNIEMLSVRTGALCLTPPVVKAVLEDRLSNIQEQENRWLFVIPLDIKKLPRDQILSIDILPSSWNEKLDYVEISYQGSLPVVNSYIDSKDIAFLTTAWEDMLALCSVYYGYNHTNMSNEERSINHQQEYISCRGKFDTDIDKQTKLDIPYGKKVTDCEGSLSLTKTSYKKDSSGTVVLKLEASNFLLIDRVPVFMSEQD